VPGMSDPRPSDIGLSDGTRAIAGSVRNCGKQFKRAGRRLLNRATIPE